MRDQHPDDRLQATAGTPSGICRFLLPGNASPGDGMTLNGTEMHSAEPRNRPLAVVSHLPCQLSGGGMYAVTWHVWQQMLRRFPGSDFVHVCPPENSAGMLKSRLLRHVLLRPGDFYPFAPAVLAETRRKVEAAIPATAEAVLFRSSTRWIHCRPDVPYFVHSDASFHTYCCNKNAAAKYRQDDLRRICDEEAAFLESAAGVFFESRWALDSAVTAYGLRGRHYHAVAVAGGMETPSTVTPANTVVRLLSIANHFRQKGGDIIFEAFRLLQPRFPQLKWHIVGGRPDFGVLRFPGIVYEGRLNPELVPDRHRYTALLASASLLLHPTREDMNPLVLLEAAGYGCPAITVNDFAIPELVEDGKTGVLLQRPVTPQSLAAAVERLIQNSEQYSQMRLAARQRALSRTSWDQIGTSMADVIGQVLGARH
jgi:glycosyltransferase involved in cell wall biosynthesis